jgi:hypothetical protein
LPPFVSASERPAVAAVFNSGFRLADAQGGYFADGRTVRPLRNRAASLVVFKSGNIGVGSWGRDFTLGGDVVAVRQNLDLIVDGGRVVGGIDNNIGHRWGKTVGNRLFVWRSGIGITASGAVVYAVGPRLSAASLANLLVAGGAVRAMELDINSNWTTFVVYHGSSGAQAETKLLPQMVRPATLYDSTSSPDFIVATTR